MLCVFPLINTIRLKCLLTSKELHEVSCDVAVGTNDTAVTRWSGGARWTLWALNRSYICL